MAARAAEFGPVYHEKIFNRSAVIVSDPLEYAKVTRIWMNKLGIESTKLSLAFFYIYNAL